MKTNKWTINLFLVWKIYNFSKLTCLSDTITKKLYNRTVIFFKRRTWYDIVHSTKYIQIIFLFLVRDLLYQNSENDSKSLAYQRNFVITVLARL